MRAVAAATELVWEDEALLLPLLVPLGDPLTPIVELSKAAVLIVLVLPLREAEPLPLPLTELETEGETLLLGISVELTEGLIVMLVVTLVPADALALPLPLTLLALLPLTLLVPMREGLPEGSNDDVAVPLPLLDPLKLFDPETGGVGEGDAPLESDCVGVLVSEVVTEALMLLLEEVDGVPLSDELLLPLLLRLKLLLPLLLLLALPVGGVVADPIALEVPLSKPEMLPLTAPVAEGTVLPLTLGESDAIDTPLEVEEGVLANSVLDGSSETAAVLTTEADRVLEDGGELEAAGVGVLDDSRDRLGSATVKLTAGERVELID